MIFFFLISVSLFLFPFPLFYDIFLLLFFFPSHPALVLVVHIPCRHFMAAKLSDTPKKVGDGKDIVCFLLGGSWYTCMGFHFISFHSSSFHYFPFAYSVFTLSAAQPAKSVGEIIEDGLGRQGESWSDSPALPYGRWRRLQRGLCLILLSGLDLAMLEHSRLPTDLHPVLELALCGQCLLFYVLGLAILSLLL